jgi:hypothetical protein
MAKRHTAAWTDVEMVTRLPLGSRERITVFDSEIAAMFVAQWPQTRRNDNPFVSRGDHDVQVDDRLCCQTEEPLYFPHARWRWLHRSRMARFCLGAGGNAQAIRGHTPPLERFGGSLVGAFVHCKREKESHGSTCRPTTVQVVPRGSGTVHQLGYRLSIRLRISPCCSNFPRSAAAKPFLSSASTTCRSPTNAPPLSAAHLYRVPARWRGA